MDDLIGGLLMLLVAGAVIAAAIAIALVLVAASAVIGSLIVGIAGASAFLWSLSSRMRRRGGKQRMPLAPEPAYELYVLGQLRRDLHSAGADAWSAMESHRARAIGFARNLMEGLMMPLGIGIIVGAYIGVVIGVVVSAVITLPVLIVSVVIMGGAWAAIGVLRLAELIRRRVRRTSYECPVDHERFPLPVYVCPGCGAEHKQLFPGRWGIVKRECQCGRVALPTMVLNGRQRVPQRCPAGHPMAGIIGFTETIRIALVAGPRAGKSTFLAGALYELDELGQSGTLAMNVVDDSRKDFDAALDNLAQGRLPNKTALGTNPALVAEIQGGARSRVLSIYDVAGESYVGEDAVRGLRFLEVPRGLVLLLDPLALDRFAADHEDEIAAAEDRLRPSPVRPIRVLESTLGALAEAGAKIETIPVAVVVGKSDALGIGAQIAELERAEGELAARTWLEQQGAGNLVRSVEHSFREVGWFSASALGRVPEPTNHTAYVPAGTVAPVLWLLRRNGVVPASAPFSPTQQAQKLSGARAADFPPIGALGWAWRAIPSALTGLAVLAAVAFGGTVGVRSLDKAAGGIPGAQAKDDSGNGGDRSGGGGGSSDEDAGGDNQSSEQTVGGVDYSLTLPASWVAGDQEVSHPGYIESRWYRTRGDDSAMKTTFIKVDYTPNVGVSAEESARSVRELVREADSYEELDWNETELDGRPALRWEFMLGDRHKVDYFVNDDCDTGYAILGQTTPGRWDRYSGTIEDAISSLSLDC